MKSNKTILIILLLFISSLFLSSKEVYLEINNNKYTYSEVVEVKSTKKNELYKRCLENFATSLSPSTHLMWALEKNGVTLSNEKSGLVVIRHSYDFESIGSYGCIIYTLKVEVKDNKYKYTISDITCSYATMGMTKKTLNEYFGKKLNKRKQKKLDKINEKFTAIINDLNSKMNQGNSDW